MHVTESSLDVMSVLVYCCFGVFLSGSLVAAVLWLGDTSSSQKKRVLVVGERNRTEQLKILDLKQEL